MKPQEKTDTRIDIATRAVITSLEKYNDNNPGKCIIKSELMPSVVRRAGWVMDDDDDPLYDSEAIAAPDDKFILNRWSEICLKAAKEYHKYIIWEPRIGIRLGTLEEYQEIPGTLLAPICQGVADNAKDRGKIILEAGGHSVIIDVSARLLESGDEIEDDNNKS